MGIEERKGGDALGGISLLNQLTLTLQEASLKLEQAYKKNNPEQVKSIKEFILKIQKKIEEELN